MNTMPTRHALLLASLGLAAPGVAQSATWVVDAAKGSGYDFVDIPAALARAADGDTVLVRPGVYTPFTMTRAVALVGSPGVTIGARTYIHVQQIPSGRVASIQGIDIAHNLLSVNGCKGQVVLERLTVDFSNQDSMRVTGGSAVQLVDSTINSLLVSGAQLVAVGSQIGNGLHPYPLGLKAAQVLLAGCHVKGGLYWTNGVPAISMDTTSVLALTDDGTALLSTHAGAGASVVVGTGTVVLDPRVVLQAPGAPIFGPGVRVIRRSTPFLRARGGPIGGTVRVTLRAGANEPFFLAVGLPGPVSFVPSLGGSIWLDLKTAILVASGRLDGSGAYAWSTPVPKDTTLRGLTLAWQGTAGPTLAQQVLSNPSSYVHGN